MAKLWNYIKENMCLYPNQTISEKNKCYSYYEIVQKVAMLSEQLSDECYGILCKSELDTAICLLACFAASKTAVVMSDRYGEAHVKSIIKLVGFKKIIVGLASDSIVQIDSGYDSYTEPLDKPAVIMCTSGTTGCPKGSIITDDNLICNTSDIRDFLPIDKRDCILIIRPLYHSSALTGEFLTALISGAKIVFCSERYNPLHINSIIADKKITIMGATPSLLYQFCKVLKSKNQLSLLKTVVISGECLTKTVAKQLRLCCPKTKFFNIYGLTEASPRATQLPCNEFDENPESVGIPLRHVSIKIIDVDGKEVLDGESGEVLLKGGSISPAYYNNDTLTNEVFLNGWLHTGDIGYIQNNRLYINGRRDDMMIKAGMNIYPKEIENAIKSCDGIYDAVAYGVNKEELTRIVLEVQTGLSMGKVFDLCRCNLDAHLMPDEIKIVSELPKNETGKIIRKR